MSETAVIVIYLHVASFCISQPVLIRSSSDWLIVSKGCFDWTMLMGLMLMHHSKEHVRKTAARKQSCKPEVRAQLSFCRSIGKVPILENMAAPPVTRASLAKEIRAIMDSTPNGLDSRQIEKDYR